MAKSRPPYAAEFRKQMVDLVRSGRAPEDLAREFEPSAQQPVVKVPAAFEQRCIPPDGVVRRLRMPNMRPPHALSAGRLAALGTTRGSTTGCQAIRNQVAQAGRDAGERTDGLRTEELEEMRRLRRENRRLREEREILFRQRAGRELLRDARVRVARPHAVGDARRGADGRVRVHRRVVQHAAAAFLAGLPLAARLRTSPRDGACGRGPVRQGARTPEPVRGRHADAGRRRHRRCCGEHREGMMAMMAHRRRIASAPPASWSPACRRRAPYRRRALWTCPAYGRPVRNGLHPQSGDTGAHSPLEISRTTAGDRAGAETARFPQFHSASLWIYSHGKPRHELNPKALTCPQNRGNLNAITRKWTARYTRWCRLRWMPAS